MGTGGFSGMRRTHLTLPCGRGMPDMSIAVLGKCTKFHGLRARRENRAKRGRLMRRRRAVRTANARTGLVRVHWCGFCRSVCASLSMHRAVRACQACRTPPDPERGGVALSRSLQIA